MTLNDAILILGPTHTAQFRTYLTTTLGKVDNGKTYTSEDLNAHVKANHPNMFKDKS